MTDRLRAGHLPGLDAADVQWRELRFAAHGREAVVEVPLLTEAQMQALARRVGRAAQETLHRMPVDAIIDVVDRAVARLLDPADPVRRRLDDLLPVVTGYDPEMVRLGLTAYLQAFRAPQLRRFVAQDFANPKVLDGFQPAVKGGAVRAFGPRVLAHGWAGNVPGLPLWSLACGLLVKAGNVGKLPSAEPVFASLLARLLAEVHPPLADCLAVVWWKGGEAGPDVALYREAEVVLAYGGNAALREVRERVPVTTRFLGYGHKLGLALVGRAALDRQRGPAAARLAALDVVRFEQQGCYSPHALYVERGGAMAPRDFAQHLAGELANLEQRHPRRHLSLAESAGVAGWRQSAEWRALAGQGGELFGDEQGPWAVAYSEAPQPFAPSAGHRCVQVSAVDALDDVVPLVQPHAAVLQTLGLAADPSELHRLADVFGQAGITRIAPLGAMTQPEAGWHHDGRFNLADLVRIVEIEQAAERAADRLAPYAQEGSP
ncbi:MULTISPECIES: acyl-CoA reductase [Ramlibacter]|uniref:Acyl-CoA reductase n=1 Tax=Ramlibacter pinisoli TaxID=2682844 RepID=A0A6N8IW02_9BURK|nr:MULTISPECIES: acyl-CoA reductase [Ramlibacter]MVQ31141.1 acyl-CoA reductase [Ramlibacter pinisoli]